MNTLSRAATAHVLSDSSRYDALRQHWSTLVNSERRSELTPAHHLLYLALLGKDWRKAFTPVTNPRKLANGAFWGWSLFRAFMQLHSPLHDEQLLAPFGGLVTAEMLGALRACLPHPKPWDYRPESFAPGSFPFDAYLPVFEGAANA